VKIIACIPARYGSTRLEGKVLARETGKFLIQHTYEQACRANLPEKVVIAADDKRIAEAAESFDAPCVLTSASHKSGTDRVAEAVLHLSADIVVNIQADEPEIEPANIDYLAELLIKNPQYQMATLAAVFNSAEQVADPNIVKVVTDKKARAVYFSRSPIPYDRAAGGIGEPSDYLRHIGLYAYRKDFLLKFTSLPQTPLEKIEKLEQLRAIEHGYKILVGKVDRCADGIDTAEQYAEFVKRYRNRQKGGE